MKKKLIAMVISVAMLFCPFSMKVEAKNTGAFSKEVFDSQYYYNHYQDLQTAIGNNPQALLDHYVKHGMAEGRWGSATFNAKIYRSNYSDLERVYGNNWSSYCYHYMNYGAAEGRNASSGNAGIGGNAQSVARGTANTTSSTTNNATISTVTTAPITGNGKVLGTYSTNYDATIPRATNLAVAVSRINGVVVQPGQEFSFSNTILPRTKENGYVVAGVFINGKVGQGVGGGICQVSSTLYSALLQTNITVTERHPHSLPVSYLPKGMDATISGTSLDLKFKNNLAKPIQIQATTNGGVGTVTVSLVEMAN